MAAQAGRALLIDLDTGTGSEVEIAGQTTAEISVSREGIIVTTKSDDGVQTMLPDVGVFGVNISFEAVLENDAFLEQLLDPAPSALYAGTVTIGGIGTVGGNFFIGNGAVTGNDGAESIGIRGELMSSGAVTYTATP